MAQFTWYAYLGIGHRRRPIFTTEGCPTDWAHLKLQVKECAIILWNERKETQCFLSLEKHLSGAYVMRWRRLGYSQRRIHYRREPEFSCKIKFNPHGEKVTISSPMFGPSLFLLTQDYYAFEKGRRFKRPASLIPKADEGLNQGDAKKLLPQPSTSFHADYDKKANLQYGGNPVQQDKWLSYNRVSTRGYLPKSLKLDEEEDEL